MTGWSRWCALFTCFVCMQTAKDWPAIQFKLSYKQPHHALNTAKQVWPNVTGPHWTFHQSSQQHLWSCEREGLVLLNQYWNLLWCLKFLMQSIADSPCNIKKILCTVQQTGCMPIKTYRPVRHKRRTFLQGGVEITPFEMYDCTEST